LKGSHEELLQGVTAIVRGCYSRRKEGWIAPEQQQGEGRLKGTLRAVLEAKDSKVSGRVEGCNSSDNSKSWTEGLKGLNKSCAGVAEEEEGLRGQGMP
jgi:hypothetical protein